MHRAAERDRKLALPAIKRRVAYRRALQQTRLELAKEEQENARIREQKRVQALEDLRNTCPYADTLSAIETSAERTRKLTKARIAAENEIRARLLAPVPKRDVDGAHSMPRNGFSADRVCSDLRWRIMNTLTKLGLQNSTYARAKLQKLVYSNPKLSKEHLTSAPGLRNMFRD